MTLVVQIPPEIEALLRAEMPNLDSEATEAMFVEFYRQQRLTRPQLATALGVGRIQLDSVLKKHQVTEDLPTSEELAEEFEAAKKALRH